MSSERWMDGMDHAWTGAMTDITDNVQTDGDFTRNHAGNLPHFCSHYFWGIVTGFQLTVME